MIINWYKTVNQQGIIVNASEGVQGQNVPTNLLEKSEISKLDHHCFRIWMLPLKMLSFELADEL